MLFSRIPARRPPFGGASVTRACGTGGRTLADPCAADKRYYYDKLDKCKARPWRRLAVKTSARPQGARDPGKEEQMDRYSRQYWVEMITGYFDDVVREDLEGVLAR